MLDQLIESKNHLSENRRRSGFFLTTFTAVFSVLTFALIYSLFSYNLAMASENLDISTLVSPVKVPNDVPPPPELIAEPKQSKTVQTIDHLPVRLENIQSTNESPIKPPTEVSTEKSNKISRPQSPFEIGNRDSEGPFSGNQLKGRNNSGENDSIGIKPFVDDSKVIDTTPPPIIKKPVTKTEQPKTVIKSGGIVNGKATNLVKPPYPAPAKAVHASGAVNVQVMIDENGNVTSANAVSGHPLLRQVSEQAAKSSKFSPTLLGTQKVKVTGVIVYNFVAQ